MTCLTADGQPKTWLHTVPPETAPVHEWEVHDRDCRTLGRVTTRPRPPVTEIGQGGWRPTHYGRDVAGRPVGVADTMMGAASYLLGHAAEQGVGAVMTVEDIAETLGVQVGSVRQYLTRGEAPAPDGYLGRTPWWRPETVDAWLTSRPGQGAGGGRPRKEKP